MWLDDTLLSPVLNIQDTRCMICERLEVWLKPGENSVSLSLSGWSKVTEEVILFSQFWDPRSFD